MNGAPGVDLLRPGSQDGNPGQRGTIMSRGRIMEVVLTTLAAVLLFIAAVGKCLRTKDNKDYELVQQF
jgi:hypothetical protein